jgi:hypothetical protein
MAVPWPQKHDILAKISLKRQSAEIPTGSPRKVYGRPFGETQSEFRRLGAFVRFMVFKGSNLPNVLICIGFRDAFEAMMCRRLRCDIGCVGACHPPPPARRPPPTFPHPQSPSDRVSRAVGERGVARLTRDGWMVCAYHPNLLAHEPTAQACQPTLGGPRGGSPGQGRAQPP